MTVRDGLARDAGTAFSAAETFARLLDRADPLASYRNEFVLPGCHRGEDTVYLLGNSLGAMPRGARAEVEGLLDSWARLGVEGFTDAAPPWIAYQESFRDALADLVGARPDEVVTMNSLTVNLHLMLASFYRPQGRRVRVLMEDHAFPSDVHAVRSHLVLHGLVPAEGLLLARAAGGEACLRTSALEALLAERGREIALVLLGAVNYYTGQWFDLPRIAEAARRQGCVVGLDLAHAVGNVPLSLHDWEVDFAVWCSYKYLNGGPGAPGGAFVHQRHGGDATRFRLAGWWGHETATRFDMRPEFVPEPGAAGWQVSTPTVLAMAPLRASLDLFRRAGMTALRRKSERLTGYLEALLVDLPPDRLRILTPAAPGERGCQLSLYVPGGGRALHAALRQRGIVTDYREPDVVRLAPVPLYNTYHEVWRAARVVRDALGAPPPPRP
jgi:kynureninase